MEIQTGSVYLIRGLSREAAHWCDFKEKLKALDFVEEVIPLEFQGVGRFYNLTSPLKISEYADFLLSQINEDNRKPKIILSISLGSMIAIEMVKKRKNFFRKVYLMNTSFSNLSPFYYRLRWKSFMDFFKIATSVDVKKKRVEYFKAYFKQPLSQVIID